MVRISQIQQFLKPLREISIPFESFGLVDLYSPRGLGERPGPETRCQVPKLLESVLTVTDQFPLKKNLVPVLAIRGRLNGHFLLEVTQR